MTREDDIRRQEARRRLQARLERNGTADSLEGYVRESGRSARGAARGRSVGYDSGYNSSYEYSDYDDEVAPDTDSDSDYDGSRSSRRPFRDRPSRSGLSIDREAGRAGGRSSRGSRGEYVRRRDYGYNAQQSSDSPLARVASTVVGVFEQFGWKLIVGVIAAIVILALIVSGVRGCMASREEAAAQEQAQAQAEQERQAQEAAQAEASANAAQQNDISTLNTAALTEILGDELEQKLVQRASEDPDVFWIASHPEEFDVDGSIIQRKLLRLAAIEPAATTFVREWPDKYPTATNEPDSTAPSSSSGTGNGVPRLYQWDQQWGYTEYSSTAFAFTGCCPTALAMVYQAKTGDTSMTPYQMGQVAMEGGYMSEYDGTSSDFLTNAAGELGLSCSELDVSTESLQSALEYGDPVIVNVGEGDFTEGGHYIVAVGIDAEGNVTVNDPFSVVNSDKTWPIETLINQTKGLYEYS